jgi:ABC-type antimicrobial peptide transport system permease subunit
VTIVGVASDAKYSSLRQEPPATVYRPIAQTSAISAATYAIRGTASQAALIAAATAAATAIEPTMRLSFESLSDQVAHSLTREQLLAVLSAFFGGLTLLLATIGVYGIMAYGVNRRRNEFGIRIAVGATPVQVIRLVSGEMARVLAAGLVIGGLIAMASTRVLRTFLYGVEPTDPAAFAGAIVILGVVAVCATLAPALRASRVDPVRALREE